MKADTVENIKDVAESCIRSKGYNSFSFREIASAVGIKSASVHYHFPTKGDLGAAVVKRYTERFLSALGDPEDSEIKPEQLIQRYIEAFRSSLIKDQKLCLCGMLGAETNSLPEEVVRETKRFFKENIKWLTAVFARYNQQEEGAMNNKAVYLLSSLEGAMMVAHTLGDLKAFDNAIKVIMQQFSE
ncbi:TetR/AcrR family transcriptional regulator [Spartinivicinus poritis]|uniref:TetR/AcrR family transcriptional regulator n=1 Tax=Spartinivicinus poritis TaxID=2994640 RepID=A0ABT5UH28_9GAMM|nr:TetR/AcrR family transcriptional regulator [Spartinivicinus sp. A2-2]MDE1465301.1 TetR/AcrR family transcriptional regulator [Spartinivicinus sp. A2-2]